MHIAGNFSEFESLTIFAIRHENAIVEISGIRCKGYFQWTRLSIAAMYHIVYGQRPSANWIDHESMNHESSFLDSGKFYPLKFPTTVEPQSYGPHSYGLFS